MVFQVFQILIFLASTELCRRIFAKHVNASESYVLATILLLQPSWFFIPQMCMYEALLIFPLVLFVFLLHSHNSKFLSKSFLAPLLTALSAMTLITIHPRTAIIVGLGLIIFRNLISKSLVYYLFVFSILPFAFLFRNGVVYGSWNLATTSDLARTGLRELMSGNFKEFLYNFACFWTDFSGYGKRGTWYHNATLDYLVQRQIGDQVRFLEWLISFALFLVLIYGLWKRLRHSPKFVTFVFMTLFSAAALDGIHFGDSRHRVIFTPLIILFSYLGAKNLLEKFIYQRNYLLRLSKRA